MKPIIKYTGGKYNEYKKFKNHIPIKINDYYEPFFGGGGVFYQLHNESRINGKSYINDISKDLIDFYNNVTNKKFIDEIKKISNVWDDIKAIGEDIYTQYGEIFFDVILNKTSIDSFINDELLSNIKNIVASTNELSLYNTHNISIEDEIYKEIKNKTNRFIKKEISNDEIDVPYKSLTTAVCQAFYFVVRRMYNEWIKYDNDEYCKEEKSSHWFFIREFCFGSMFRFSKDGNFNIPYGGYNYNSKCFMCKVNEIISDNIQSLFKDITATNLDFSLALDKDFDINDFIFLDPPYDSTFSDYDGNAFTKDDHKRLKECLDKVECKWLLIIRKTDFILELYKDYNQEEFDKTYAYQARGKYEEKNSIHLIIKNF